MTIKKDKNCPDCYGLGWCISTVNGSMRVPDGTMEIHKCDTCQVYKWDDGAKHSPQARMALLAAKNGTVTYRSYMFSLTKHQDFAPKVDYKPKSNHPWRQY